jgi:hypothetical protein
VLEIDDIEIPNLDDEEWSDSEFCGDINSLGVWYASGCAFYFEDGDEDHDDEEELPN